MNSVVAEWLWPWEFVSRACCWMGEHDVFGEHGKVKGRCLVGGIGGRRGQWPLHVLPSFDGGGVSSRCPRVICTILAAKTILNCRHTDT